MAPSLVFAGWKGVERRFAQLNHCKLNPVEGKAMARWNWVGNVPQAKWTQYISEWTVMADTNDNSQVSVNSLLMPPPPIIFSLTSEAGGKQHPQT